MSKTAGKDTKDPTAEVHVCRNRRASHDYALTDSLECGIALVGTEVKSLRDGHANLEDSYAHISDNELWLIGCEIPEYLFGNRLNHKPKRTRKLLARRAEIRKFAALTEQKGFTLVPVRIYFKGGRAKVEIAVGKGKQSHDKRQSLKAAESRREIDRAMARKRRG